MAVRSSSPRSDLRGETLVNQISDCRFEGGAAFVKKAGNLDPRRLTRGLQDRRAVGQRGFIAGIDPAVHKSRSQAPRERMLSLAQVVTKLEARHRPDAIKPDDNLQAIRLEPAPTPGSSLLLHIFDFVQHAI